MPIDQEHAPVHGALERWAAVDVEGTLAHFSEDVLYLINVDGVAVPFASSTLGKEDLRQRLHFVKATFDREKFEVESIVHEHDRTRAAVHIENRHRQTGELLVAKVRLCYWTESGLIVRVEERRDAPYIEAFQRFVFHMENAARSD